MTEPEKVHDNNKRECTIGVFLPDMKSIGGKRQFKKMKFPIKRLERRFIQKK